MLLNDYDEQEMPSSPYYRLKHAPAPTFPGFAAFFGIPVLCVPVNMISRGAALLLMGAIILAYGFAQNYDCRKRGWYGRLTDKYMMISGAAIAISAVFSFFHYERLMNWTLGIFLATLGIIMPILRKIELVRLKHRCTEILEAECADIIMFRANPPTGCPVFRVQRNGQETYLCDEWFNNPRWYHAGDVCTIYVHPERDTEIYDEKRAKAEMESTLISWLSYDFILIVGFVTLWYGINK